MAQIFQEKNIRLAFRISVILKGLNALVEIIGGVLAFIISKEFIIKFVFTITQEELSEDPQDFIAHYLIKSAEMLSLSSQHFFAYYLLIHGVIKISLIIGLLRNKLWAYPAALVFFALFIFYQIYRYTYTHSIWLLVLTIFDLLVIWLAWHEYKYLKVARNNK